MQSTSDPARQRKLRKSTEADDKTAPSSSAELNNEVATAVVKGLSHFGAGQVVESLVYILELEHSVDLYSLGDNLDALKAALQRMFGGASYVIEAKISEALAKRLGVDPEGKSLDDLVAMLGKELSSNK